MKTILTIPRITGVDNIEKGFHVYRDRGGSVVVEKWDIPGSRTTPCIRVTDDIALELAAAILAVLTGEADNRS